MKVEGLTPDCEFLSVEAVGPLVAQKSGHWQSTLDCEHELVGQHPPFPAALTTSPPWFLPWCLSTHITASLFLIHLDVGSAPLLLDHLDLLLRQNQLDPPSDGTGRTPLHNRGPISGIFGVLLHQERQTLELLLAGPERVVSHVPLVLIPLIRAPADSTGQGDTNEVTMLIRRLLFNT